MSSHLQPLLVAAALVLVPASAVPPELLGQNSAESSRALSLTAARAAALSRAYTSPPANAELRLDLDGEASQNGEPGGSYSTRTLDVVLAPAILATVSVLSYCEDGLICRSDINEFHTRHFPDFETNLDDYTAEITELVTLGLNLTGVKGRNNFGRALISWGTSWAIGNSLMTLGKRNLDVERPDGSSLSSFPSGHTTRAFVGATFMHKEYGPRSVYYSIAAYTTATVTGALRQLNNVHWISDVTMGAAVGILSTELGYLLVDDIMKDTWSNLDELPPRPSPDRPLGNPSFLDFKLGAARSLGDLSERDDEFAARNGISYGFEGAYFLNRWLGVGGEYSIGNFPLEVGRSVPVDSSISGVMDPALTTPLGMQSLYAGPFVSFPLAERLSINGKTTVGWASGATSTVAALPSGAGTEGSGEARIPIAAFDPRDTIGFAVGASIRGRVSRAISLSVYGEYNYSAPDVEIFRATAGSGLELEKVGEAQNVRFDYVALGAVISAMIW